MRGRGRLLGFLAGVLALLGVLAAIPASVVVGFLPDSVTRHRLLWIGLLAVIALAIFVAAWLSTLLGGRVAVAERWQVPPPPAGYVDRAELAQAVSALTASGGIPVALTTGLIGAGGFGKTTLAAKACHDPAVRRRFRSGVWVTVGRDADEAALAAKISGVVRDLGGDSAGFADLERAGRALAGVLRKLPGPVLMVADDVWNQEQLAAFLAASQVGTLLVTTRRPGALDNTGARQVKVDQVSGAVAEALLTRDLPPLGPGKVHELLALAGGWPLLLGLINRRLREDVARNANLRAAAADVATRLRRDGPEAIEFSDSGSRATAAAATIGYSLEALREGARERFLELGIFAEDAKVPVADAAMLWQTTAGLDEAGAVELCERLDGLSLLSLAWDGDARTISMHDVLRDFARASLGPRVVELNGVLVDEAASRMQVGPETQWWGPGVLGGYLRSHLIWHLCQAGRTAVAEAVACDLRWAESQLKDAGPAAVAADLAEAGTSRALRMRVAVMRVAHLLDPAVPSAAIVDVLHSRLAADLDWGPQVAALRDGYARPRLVNRWRLPDLPDPAQLALLEGHQGSVSSVCPVTVAGRDLLASGHGGTVRIWDPATGELVRTLPCKWARSVCRISVADRDLLACALGVTLQVWDPATGELVRTLRRQEYVFWSLCRVTVAGRDLLACGIGGSVRILDPATGWFVRTLRSHQVWVTSLCSISVAGQDLLASGSGDDGTVQIWDPAARQLGCILQGHEGPVWSLSPVTVAGRDLLASASGLRQGTVRIWDPATGELVRTMQVHQAPALSVCPVTVAGRDLLASGSGGTVRIWDPGTGELVRILRGHEGPVWSLSPVTVKGRDLLASGGQDGTVRIWDPAVRHLNGTRRVHRDPVSSLCRITVDGRDLLASGSGDEDGTVRIWDPDTGELVRPLRGHQGPVSSVCQVTVDGQDVLVSSSGGEDGTVRIWDPAAGELVATLQGSQTWVTSLCPVTVAGRDLLATGSGGDGTVRIWDPAAGKLIRALRGHQGPVWSLCRVTTAGRDLLASVGGFGDETVRIWDPAADELIGILRGHQGLVRSLCPVAVAGQDLLAMGCVDGTVRIWDPANNRWVGTLRGFSAWVTSLCPVSVPGRDLLAIGSGREVWIRDPSAAKPQVLMRVERPLRSCTQVGSSGLAVGGEGGLYLFDYLSAITEPTRSGHGGRFGNCSQSC